MCCIRFGFQGGYVLGFQDVYDLLYGNLVGVWWVYVVDFVDVIVVVQGFVFLYFVVFEIFEGYVVGIGWMFCYGCYDVLGDFVCVEGFCFFFGDGVECFGKGWIFQDCFYCFGCVIGFVEIGVGYWIVLKVFFLGQQVVEMW